VKVIRVREGLAYGFEYESIIIVVNDDQVDSMVEELTKLTDTLGYVIRVENPDTFESVKEDLELAVSELVETGVLEECPSCQKLSSTVEEQFSYGIYAGKMCRMCATSKFNDTCGHEQPMGNVRELDDCGDDDD
jgi:hypothetical protein